MADLSNLFTNSRYSRFSSPNLESSFSERPVSSPFLKQQTNNNTNGWKVANLEAALKKGVKTEISQEYMKEELKMFSKKMYEMLLKKSFCLGAIIVILYFLLGSMQAFLLGSMLAIELLLGQPFSIIPFIEDSKASIILKGVRQLFKATFIYCLLKQWFWVSHGRIDWSFTFQTLTATAVTSIIQLYRPLVSGQYLVKAVKSKSPIDKIKFFAAFTWQKINFLADIKHHILFFASVSLVAAFLFCRFFGQCDWQFLRPEYLIMAFLLAFISEIIADAIYFMDQIMFDPLMQVSDMLPIFLGLLRLKQSPRALKVQQACLKSLYLRMLKVECFLSSETCKSLIYRSYMDIFDQYASNRLQSLNSRLVDLARVVTRNQEILGSSKSMVEDAFIYIRKINAFINSELACFSMLLQIAQASFLFGAIGYSETEARQINQGIRISSRVRQVLQSIGIRLLECGQNKSLSTVLRQQLVKSHSSLTKKINCSDQ